MSRGVHSFLLLSHPGAEVLVVLLAVLPLLVIAGAVILGNLPAAQPPQTNLGIDAEPLPPYFHLLLVPLLIIGFVYMLWLFVVYSSYWLADILI